jgi:hypothetical protein
MGGDDPPQPSVDPFSTPIPTMQAPRSLQRPGRKSSLSTIDAACSRASTPATRLARSTSTMTPQTAAADRKTGPELRRHRHLCHPLPCQTSNDFNSSNSVPGRNLTLTDFPFTRPQWTTSSPPRSR